MRNEKDALRERFYGKYGCRRRSTTGLPGKLSALIGVTVDDSTQASVGDKLAYHVQLAALVAARCMEAGSRELMYASLDR